MAGRILYLDGLRGILAVIVFVHHFFYAFCPEIIFGGSYENYLRTGPFSVYKVMGLTPLNILYNPGMAIHFFFLLSGYVQTRRYFHRPDTAFLQKSLLKRYFRLALPVLAVVILVYVSHSLFLFKKNLIPANDLTAGWLKSLLPNNLHFWEVIHEGLVNCFRGNSRYYQVLWTMPTELINSYLVLALLLALHNLRYKTQVIVTIMVIQFVALKEYYSVAFVAGMLFAHLEATSEKFNTFLSRRLVKFICLILGLYFGSYPFTGYQNAAAHSVYAPISFFEVYPHVISYLLGVVFLFCFLQHSAFFKRLLSGKLFLFFGKISFMFYLIHLLLLLTLSPLVYQAFQNSHDGGFDLAITGMLSFGATTCAALVLTQLVDKPVIKAANMLVKKLF